ncbi:MAG: phosphotransferase [Acidimicrobiales bacterium]
MTRRGTARTGAGLLTEDLRTLLQPHVGRQRWYGGTADDQITLVDAELLDPPWPALLRAVFESPRHERYQAILGLRELSSGADPSVGVLRLAEGEAACVDGTIDEEFAIALLRHVAPDEMVHTARPIGAEQSNTSIVYDERIILKIFRRLVGSNPEVEVTSGLMRAGFAHVAHPVAVWQHGGDDLGVLQPFLAGGVDGWALASTSLQVLLAEAGAPGHSPGDSPGDFAPEARRLGDVTAELHLTLAQVFGAHPGDAGEWVETITARAAAVAAAGIDAGVLEAQLGGLRTAADVGSSIRIHGDFHLGQVMRTAEGWFVLDFEGEPTRPVDERRRPSSPLRDVAGMLRSLSYATAAALRDNGGAVGTEAAAAWEQRNRAAFLGSYFARLAGSPLLPRDPAVTAALLDAFEVDKAVYEVAYEVAHRPDWAAIPLAAVRRLVPHP